ncbi:hypothetical protein QAD02_003632 [Eretmocerus hayati]|uniref:Uncharacterized protein n=1 Tax=Eretmocerus hayati TaxID=131215 RepID=A0ACC2NNB9_9HYME|nr:hypothetical protein QAD02_003632 [Eretmocerus hayati]
MLHRRQLLRALVHISTICLLLVNHLNANLRESSFRRWWVKPHLKLRDRYGAYSTIFEYFKLRDEEEFFSFTGMTLNQFQRLHNLVRHRLTKYSPRGSLSAELKLAATLNYMVHDTSVKEVAWHYLIGRTTLYEFIPDVCRAISETLRPRYMRFPSNNQEWDAIAQGFWDKYQIPNCVGALDGKHFRIRQPAHSGASFWNWKRFYSVNVMAVCDSDGYFMWVSAGALGSLNDSTVFRNTNLGAALYQDDLPIINQRSRLPNTDVNLTRFLIADGGFPLERFMLRPFPTVRPMPLERRIFNIRLGTARRVIERAFGILTKKFRCFENPLDFNLETIDLIILTSFILHNYLLTESRDVDVDRHRYGHDSDDDDSSSDEDSELEDDASSLASQSSSGISCEESSRSRSSDSDASMDDADDGSDVEQSSSSSSSEESSEVSSEDEEFDDVNPDAQGELMRDILCQYFTSPAGNVEWQWDLI